MTLTDPVSVLTFISIVMGLLGMLGFCMQIYALWLNHRQAQVKKDSARMVQLLEIIEHNTRKESGGR
jgi:hypothetical protein